MLDIEDPRLLTRGTCTDDQCSTSGSTAWSGLEAILGDMVDNVEGVSWWTWWVVEDKVERTVD